MINVIPQIFGANLAITPKNVFEIGSRDADDAIAIARMINVPNSAVSIFEPHPDLYRQIVFTKSDINAYQLGCSNKNGVLPFYSCIIGKEQNYGMSSLIPRKEYEDTIKYKKIEVKTVRMDDWMTENAVDEIDVLKLDVEGHTWEVLDGFGERISQVKAIHLEAERKQIWDGQKLFSDTIQKLLPTHAMVFCYDMGGQSDSIWIEKKCLK